MRCVERVSDLARDAERFGDGDQTRDDHVRQRGALDELEHERGEAIGFFEAVDRADVRMIERRQDPRFAREAREALGIAREHARQNLDRDVATELRIARAVDLAHPTGTEARDDPVLRDLMTDQ
jgi:hypothetical protein